MRTPWFPFLTIALLLLAPVQKGQAQHGDHSMGGPGDGHHGHGNDRDRDREPDKPDPPPVVRAQRQIQVEVTEKGFVPNQIEVKVKEWVEFVFTRTTDNTCAKRVIFDLGGNETIQHNLPLNKPVTFTSRFERSGTVPFACEMKMVTGSVVVR